MAVPLSSQNVRNRDKIKKDLMKRAFSGASRRTPEEMQFMIDEYIRRGNEISKYKVLADMVERFSNGKAGLSQSQIVSLYTNGGTQTRAVNALNFLEAVEGTGNRHVDTVKMLYEFVISSEVTPRLI